MTRGRSICNVLKTIRTQIAKANEIKYEPRECHHTGECRGTCPACEAEVRYIERQLDIRRQLGKAVTIVGISAGLSALTGCGDKAKKVEEVERDSLTVGKVLCFLVLTLKDEPSHLRESGFRLGVDDVVRLSRPDGLLVQLDMLYGRCSEHHAANDTVAHGQCLRPRHGRLVIPQLMPSISWNEE